MGEERERKGGRHYNKIPCDHLDSSPPSIRLPHINIFPNVILKPFFLAYWREGRPRNEAKTDTNGLGTRLRQTHRWQQLYLSWRVLLVSLHLLQSAEQQMTLVSLPHGPLEGSHQFLELLQHSFGPWGELIQLSDPQWRSWQPYDLQGVCQIRSFVLQVVSFLRSLSPVLTDSFPQIG